MANQGLISGTQALPGINTARCGSYPFPQFLLLVFKKVITLYHMVCNILTHGMQNLTHSMQDLIHSMQVILLLYKYLYNKNTFSDFVAYNILLLSFTCPLV